jgi:hypothetical protein
VHMLPLLPEMKFISHCFPVPVAPDEPRVHDHAAPAPERTPWWGPRGLVTRGTPHWWAAIANPPPAYRHRSHVCRGAAAGDGRVDAADHRDEPAVSRRGRRRSRRRGRYVDPYRIPWCLLSVSPCRSLWCARPHPTARSRVRVCMAVVVRAVRPAEVAGDTRLRRASTAPPAPGSPRRVGDDDRPKSRGWAQQRTARREAKRVRKLEAKAPFHPGPEWKARDGAASASAASSASHPRSIRRAQSESAMSWAEARCAQTPRFRASGSVPLGDAVRRRPCGDPRQRGS